MSKPVITQHLGTVAFSRGVEKDRPGACVMLLKSKAILHYRDTGLGDNFHQVSAYDT